MTETIHNPYERLGDLWLRGNFHGHCAQSSACATVRLAGSIRRYRKIGATFTAYTDHDTVTRLTRARARHPDVLLFEGFEHSKAENLLFVGEKVPPLHRLPLADALTAAEGLLTIVCHPRPRPEKQYWSRELVRALPRLPDGVEVYNGHYGVPRMRRRGFVPRYTELWDEYLTHGLWLWGFANDDSHDRVDYGNAWNMVCTHTCSLPAILEAARAGRFYGTTGLLAAEIRGDGPHLLVRFDQTVTGRFVGPGGRTLSQGQSDHFEHRLGQERYARFEGEAEWGHIFLQPVRWAHDGRNAPPPAAPRIALPDAAQPNPAERG